MCTNNFLESNIANQWIRQMRKNKEKGCKQTHGNEQTHRKVILKYTVTEKETKQQKLKHLQRPKQSQLNHEPDRAETKQLVVRQTVHHLEALPYQLIAE